MLTFVFIYVAWYGPRSQGKRKKEKGTPIVEIEFQYTNW